MQKMVVGSALNDNTKTLVALGMFNLILGIFVPRGITRVVQATPDDIPQGVTCQRNLILLQWP